MPDSATDGSGTTSSHTSTLTLPDVPPEGSLKHVVLISRKDLDLALAECMMLEVANKKDDPRCETLIDFD